MDRAFAAIIYLLGRRIAEKTQKYDAFCVNAAGNFGGGGPLTAQGSQFKIYAGIFPGCASKRTRQKNYINTLKFS